MAKALLLGKHIVHPDWLSEMAQSECKGPPIMPSTYAYKNFGVVYPLRTP